MLNSSTFQLTGVKIKSFDSIINKRKKIFAYPIQPEKKDIFIKKLQKIQFFDLRYAILKRHAYESDIETINSEVTNNWSQFFYIPYVVWKIGFLTKNTENPHFWL